MIVEWLSVLILLGCDFIVNSHVQFYRAECILFHEEESYWDQMIIGVGDFNKFIVTFKKVVNIDWLEHGVKVCHLRKGKGR